MLFYDGLDRLVEVRQAYDNTYDLYSKHWITRYLYDLTGGQQTFHSQSFSAYGNLFEIQELLPPNPPGPILTVTTPPSPGAISNTTYLALKATAYDGLDRPVTSYSAMGTGSNITTETLTWDTSPLDQNGIAGYLGEDCNGASPQQCQEFDYTPDGEQKTFQSSDGSSPQRSYTYDADGRPTQVSESGITNPQQYSYDVDGNLNTSTDAGNPNSATLTYHHYPDGTEKSLDVASDVLNQTGLLTYSYRNDGPLQTEVVDDTSLGSGVQHPGQTTLSYAFTDAGRFSTRSETGVDANTGLPGAQIQYSANLGTPSKLTLPETTLTPLNYSLDGELVFLSDANCLPNIYYFYTLRGEEAASSLCSSSSGGKQANGLPLLSAGTQGQSTWNDLMAVMSKLAPSSPPPSSWNYDQAGRMTSQSAPYPRFSPSPSPVPATRNYDAENHLSVTTLQSGANQSNWPYESITWGPDGHPFSIATSQNGNSASPERLHWDGDQLLFTSHNSNGHAVLDDVKLDVQGDVLPGDTYSGITFYDRGPGGLILGCHNTTGTSYTGFGTGWGGDSRCLTNLSPPNAAMPNSLVWTGSPYGGALTVGSGGTLALERPDGFTDGYDTIQGIRDYDNTSGAWTTPDSDFGDIYYPPSLKSYLWNGNDPMGNSDSSGSCIDSFTGLVGYAIGIATVCEDPDVYTFPFTLDDPGLDAFNSYYGSLSNPLLTIAVVKAFCIGCSQINKHFGLTMSCRSTATNVMGAVEGHFARFGNYSRWNGLESVTFNPPAGMTVGSIIPITVSAFIFDNENLSVTVQSMSPQSMTFTTNSGHLLYPGHITFAASPSAEGFIDFNIDLGGTVAKPFQFYAGGNAFEDAQWHHFLGQVANYCGVGH